MAEGRPFPASAAMPYVDRRLETLEYDQAKRVWADLRAKGIIRAEQPADDLVF